MKIDKMAPQVSYKCACVFVFMYNINNNKNQQKTTTNNNYLAYNSRQQNWSHLNSPHF